jgi:hypothetical protein
MQVNSAAVAAYPGASKVVVTQSGVEQGEGRVPDIGFWSSPQASLARGASTATLSWFVNNAGGTRAYEYNVASGEIGNLGDPVLGTPDTQFAVQVEVRGPENQLLAADSLNCTGSAASIALPITTR